MANHMIRKGPLRGTYVDDSNDLLVSVSLGELRQIRDLLVDVNKDCIGTRLGGRAFNLLTKEFEHD